MSDTTCPLCLGACVVREDQAFLVVCRLCRGEGAIADPWRQAFGWASARVVMAWWRALVACAEAAGWVEDWVVGKERWRK